MACLNTPSRLPVPRTLLPLMQQTGVATAEEVGVDTLAARLRDEAVAKKAVLVLPPLIGAWARKPRPDRWLAFAGREPQSSRSTTAGDVSVAWAAHTGWVCGRHS